MPDLGRPVSYLALPPGADVFDAAGEHVGKVGRVVAADDLDIFEGVVVDAQAAPGGQCFARAEQIESMFERGLVLNVSVSELPAPQPEPPVVRIEPEDAIVPGQGWLQRQWARLRGRQ